MGLKEFLKPSWITIVAFIVLMILFAIIPIVPCQISPDFRIPVYKWSVCSLNPIMLTFSIGTIYHYFGLGDNMLIIIFLISLIISYLLASLVNSFFKKKR